MFVFCIPEEIGSWEQTKTDADGGCQCQAEARRRRSEILSTRERPSTQQISSWYQLISADSSDHERGGLVVQCCLVHGKHIGKNTALLEVENMYSLKTQKARQFISEAWTGLDIWYQIRSIRITVQSCIAPPLDATASFSRALDVEVQKRFPVLPFTLRAIEDEQACHEALLMDDKSVTVPFVTSYKGAACIAENPKPSCVPWATSCIQSLIPWYWESMGTSIRFSRWFCTEGGKSGCLRGQTARTSRWVGGPGSRGPTMPGRHFNVSQKLSEFYTYVCI